MTADTPAGMDEAAIDPESDEVWAFAKTIMAHMVDETYGNASGYVLRDDPRNLALSLMRSGYRKPDAARAEVESARAVLAAVAALADKFEATPDRHMSHANVAQSIRTVLAADPAASTEAHDPTKEN